MITYLLAQSSDVENIIMVGDTAYDVIGAAAHKIPCVGVSWGYGLVKDMVEAGACAIADTPEDLIKILEA